MSIFGLSSLITSILSLVIGAFVISKNSKSLLNISWALVSLCAAIWAFGLFGVVEANTAKTALIFQYILDASGIFIPIFFFLFVLELLGMYKIKKKLLNFFFLLSFLLLLLSFTTLFKRGVAPAFNFNYWINPGILYYLFPLYFAVLVLLSVYFMVSKYKYLVGTQKQQVTYVILTALFGFGGGATNFFPQLINTYPFGNFFVIFYVFTISYAIIKYRLMDIRLVITKSILYFFLVLFVAISFTFITFSTAQFLQGQGRMIVTLVVSLIIVTLLDPLKKLLAKWTDKFFYKGKIDYQSVLRELGQDIARELDLKKLVVTLKENLQKQIKLKKVYILFIKNNSDEVNDFETIVDEHKIKLADNSQLIQYLKNKKELIITEELNRKASDTNDKLAEAMFKDIEKELDALKIALAIPIFTEDRLTGVFLIENKLSGGAFTQEDINFFELLAPQTATALEKSKLFDEVQSAKANLEILVEQRTADLKERNQYLMALQNLISIITRSLDFKKVMQTIADGINKELGFIGGMLNFIDHQRDGIYIGAISNTPDIKEIIAMIPRAPETYLVPLSASENLAIQAIEKQEIIAGDRFYDFVVPAISKELSNKIQSHLGAKSILAVPIYSEEKVIGVIDYVLAEEADHITPVQKEMMKSLADQVGIVYRNLDLYNEIQRTNQDLKQANIRLTNLDKAKSEFLSIASHQLRTPLTGIKGYLSMILEGDFGNVPANIKNIIEEVFQNTDRLTRLVNIFLNVSRIESGKFEMVKKDADMIQIIEGVISTLELTAKKKKLDIIFHKPKKLIPMINIDKEKVQDVLLNLVDNAIKYTPKGKVEISVEKIGEALQITVKDTGIGINKGEDKELFKKFVRGEGSAQINTGGSGLGLFIAKKIVEAHEGKIWAESAGKGMGSSFIFTLPM